MGLLGDAIGAAYNEAQDTFVIEEALAEMDSMCGNEGQHAIIDKGTSTFTRWAENTLRKISQENLQLQLLTTISESAFNGTQDIWGTGEDMIEDQAENDLVEGDEGDVGEKEKHGFAFDGLLGDILDFIF